MAALAGPLDGAAGGGGATDARAGEPVITLLDPTLDQPRTRTGLPVVQIRSFVPTRTFVGRVDAPSRLVSLTVNDVHVQPDDVGMFSIEVPLRPDGPTKVAIVAIDAAPARGALSFAFQPPEVTAGTAVAATGQVGADQPALPRSTRAASISATAMRW